MFTFGGIKLRPFIPSVYKLALPRAGSSGSQKTFEYSKENQIRVDALLSFFPEKQRRGAMVPLLDLAQRQHGWLPMSALQKVGEMLNVDTFKVFQIASFYPMFRLVPSGKYRISVCTNTSCFLRGSDMIMEVCKKHLKLNVGDTSKDMKFSLAEGECLGACVNAPMMAINDDFYEDLTEKDVLAILEDLKADRVPPAGPRSGRFASEPKNGLSSLTHDPLPPGYKMQDLC